MLKLLVLFVAIAPLTSAASELSSEQVENCIYESQQLKVDLDFQHEQHRRLNQRNQELTSAHQQLTEQTAQLTSLRQQLKTCTNGCNHVQAKFNSFNREFEQQSSEYSNLLKQYEGDKQKLTSDTSKNKEQLASYTERCQIKSLSEESHQKYCVQDSPEAPFCSGKF